MIWFLKANEIEIYEEDFGVFHKQYYLVHFKDLKLDMSLYLILLSICYLLINGIIRKTSLTIVPKI